MRHQGFFDCVSHPIAREALGRLIADAQQRNPSLRIEPRALQIFEAYLACYSFQTTVLCGPALENLKMNDPDGEFKWHEEALQRLYGTVSLPAIGVPQGGALSAVIANAILHAADKALKVLEQKLGRRFTYMRYCDDMILLAPNPADCAAAFREYRRVLRRLRLPEHPPQVVRAYNAKFWSNKSNFRYRWAQPTRSGVVPWMQFVGYQVRYDGLVRIRPKSLLQTAPGA